MGAEEFAVEIAKNPAVRATVFATVTLQEATFVVHSPWRKPWRDAALLMISDDLTTKLNPDPDTDDNPA